MRSIHRRANSRDLGRRCFRSGEAAAWIAFVLIAIAATATEARADFYTLNPVATGGVDADSGGPVTQYSYSGSEVGSGRGFLQYHETLAYESFDLSGIKGQISQITLSGTVSGLSLYFYGDSGGYMYLNGGVYLLGANPALATDPASLFQILPGQTGLGSFTVDNGLTPPFGYPPTPFGDTFSITLNPSLLLGTGSSSGGLGTISLGFSGSGAAYDEFGEPYGGGVEGNLSAELRIRTVPEPASMALCLVGAAGLWRIGGKRRPRPRKLDRS